MVDLKTIKEKYFGYAVVILIVIVVILLFRQRINFYWLLLGLGLVLFMLFYRPKGKDIYKIAELIQLKHLKNTGETLDISNIEADEMPLGSGRLVIMFKSDGKAFTFYRNLILGLQIKELQNIRYDMEKSKLVETVTKTQSVQDKIKEGAKKLGIDTESLGLE